MSSLLLFLFNRRQFWLQCYVEYKVTCLLLFVLPFTANAQISFQTRSDTAFISMEGFGQDDVQINLGPFEAWSVDTTHTGWIPVMHVLLVSQDTTNGIPQWYAYGLSFFNRTYYEYHSAELLFTQWPAILQSMPRPRAIQRLREVMKFWYEVCSRISMAWINCMGRIRNYPQKPTHQSSLKLDSCSSNTREHFISVKKMRGQFPSGVQKMSNLSLDGFV